MIHLIKPYGGTLQNLLADEARGAALKLQAQDFPSITLSQRQLCDLELLTNGAFSPLRGFMTREMYECVLEKLHLPGGLLWPMPIVLDVPDGVAARLEPGGYLGLNDPEGFMLAVLRIEDKWKPDKKREAQIVYGTDSLAHPGVRYLHEQTHPVCVGGRLEGVQAPMHYDFTLLRHSPEKLRGLFDKMGWRRIMAFNTSKPMHRVHRDITLHAADELNANILLHPVIGMAKPGDLHYYARVRCYQAIQQHYPAGKAFLSLCPMAVRMAGPREGIMNAIVRQNYGCSYMIVGPDHASPPGARTGESRFYPEYASQEMIVQYQDELDIRMIPVEEMRYVPSQDKFVSVGNIERDGLDSEQFTEKDLKHHLALNKPVPGWFSYPDVLSELIKVCPPRQRSGITIFFTGLSGAGKSTLAKIIYAKFIEAGNRPVTLLDGDVVRLNLSSELGFSKEHRDLNVRRIGFVAGEITKNGGIAICAPIAPYAATRRAVRDLVEQHGAFIEIHVATPLEICERRDRKGLYTKARQGIIREFTGVSDPYERPENPELRIDTTTLSPLQAAEEIILYLVGKGYLGQEEEINDPKSPLS